MIQNIVDSIINFINSLGAFAPVAACLLIIVESMVPVLPLCVFITINFISFGNIIGFIISWIFTCLGCFLSYYLSYKGFAKFKIEDKEEKALLKKLMNILKNRSLPFITVVVAIPFTPAFLVNIAAGYSKMKFKKFATAILIGKLFMVYFWGFIGVNLLECVKNPLLLIKVFAMVLIAFIISSFAKRYVDKK